MAALPDDTVDVRLLGLATPDGRHIVAMASDLHAYLSSVVGGSAAALGSVGRDLVSTARTRATEDEDGAQYEIIHGDVVLWLVEDEATGTVWMQYASQDDDESPSSL